MNPGVIVLIGAASVLILFSRAASGKSATGLDAIFDKYGNQYGVDPALLKAIASVESSLNPNAINAGDRYSVGLMQILYRPSTADRNSPPTNRFDIDGWRDATFDKLKDPDFNVKMGAQILAWNIKTYGLPRAIAVYNAWDQRAAPVNGPFKNQAYVNKVLAHYLAFLEE